MKTSSHQLSLGLDLSTQSISAVILDIDSGIRIFEHSLDYVKDPRLNSWGIQRRDYLIPPRVEGEADQPPRMFFAGIDAMFNDIRNAGISLNDIAVITDSGQQHGHVYLNSQSSSIFSRLNEDSSSQSDLVSLLEGCLAYGSAPIWMTANTVWQAECMRKSVGGKKKMIELSGSDVPLRFTGPVIMRVAQQFPESYRRTAKIQLLSSLVPAILTGNSNVPVDFGNACGMSLMHYRLKKWSDQMIQAAAEGLPGGKRGLRNKLPRIVAPDSIVGTIADYFIKKYGFNPECAVAAGSGDNPQAKVLVAGDLLSLGTSFVNMTASDPDMVDSSGLTNAMYDGVGRPFLFSCRTNGALVWDQLRAAYGIKKEEYGVAEEALQKTPVACNLVFWQPRTESFPPSGSFDLTRVDCPANLGGDYSGLIETTLSAVYYYSRHFTRNAGPLFVTGGASRSPGILRRIAAIWNRPVISIENAGASMGAAVSGISALYKSKGKHFDVKQYSLNLQKRKMEIQPRPEDVSSFHDAEGFLKKFAAEETRLLKANPIK
jgi:xylulokinase